LRSTVVFEQDTATVVVAEEVSANVMVPEPACTVSEKVSRYVKSLSGPWVVKDPARALAEKVGVGSLRVPALTREAKLRARNAILIILGRKRGDSRSDRKIFRDPEYLVQD
jgi:hypothetical protein